MDWLRFKEIYLVEYCRNSIVKCVHQCIQLWICVPVYEKEGERIFTDSSNRERKNDVPFKAFPSGNAKPIKMQNALKKIDKSSLHSRKHNINNFTICYRKI